VNNKIFVSGSGQGTLGVGLTTIIAGGYLKETSNKPHILYSLFVIHLKTLIF
jgi:hypothetical protein